MVRRPSILIVVALAGCAKMAPNVMMAPSPEAELEYKEHLSLQEIEGLKPQLRFPIKLAVSQPSSGYGWTRDEIALIESWLEPLREQGFADELVVLPESLADSCGWRRSYNCGVMRNRRTAARFQADALLIIAAQTEVRSYANPMSIFNLTVLGLWLVPGHHRAAETVLEGSLVDNRNEYLYAFARAYGQAKHVRPYVYASSKKATVRSRLRALEVFGANLVREVQRHDYAGAP